MLAEDADDPDADHEGTGTYAVTGVTFDLPALLDGDLSIGGEVDLLQVHGPDGNAAEPGRAAYGNVTWQVGDATVLLEYKDYTRFLVRATQWRGGPYELRYHQPPTLERPEAEVKNNHNVRGGRIRLDYDLADLLGVDLALHANHGRFEGAGDESDPTDQISGGFDASIVSTFGGLELFWLDGDGHLLASGGKRSVQNTALDLLSSQETHLEVTVEQLVFERHSVRLSAAVLWRGAFDRIRADSEDGVYRWREAETTLSYKWSPHVAASMTFERQEDERTTGDGPRNYYSAALQFFVSDSTHVSVTAGSNRPGLKCLNGNCRYTPSYNGVTMLFVGHLPVHGGSVR